MLRIVLFDIALLLLALPLGAAERSAANVAAAIDFLKTACGEGETVRIEGLPGPDATSLQLDAKQQLTLAFSKEDLRGVTRGLDDALLGQDRKDVRECMKPYIARILDVLLPDNEVSRGGREQSGASAGRLLAPNASTHPFRILSGVNLGVPSIATCALPEASTSVGAFLATPLPPGAVAMTDFKIVANEIRIGNSIPVSVCRDAKTGQLMLNAEVKDVAGKRIVVIRHSEWEQLDHQYDRNFTSSLFEVVDRDHEQPLLQVWLRDDIAVVSGIFYENGVLLILTPEGLLVSPSPQRRFSLCRVFLYPGALHPGELDNDCYSKLQALVDNALKEGASFSMSGPPLTTHAP